MTVPSGSEAPRAGARRDPWPLAAAAAFAVPCATLARSCLPLGALIAAAGIAFAVATRHRLRLAGLAGLPALLAALPAPPPAVEWPPPGPVRVAGTVTEVVRTPHTGETFVRLGDPRRGVRLHCSGDLAVLPGDRVHAVARAGAQAAPGLEPSLYAARDAVRVEPGPPSVPRLAAATRRALERELLRCVPGENGALLATLVLGRQTMTSPDLLAAHRATGLSHLLAVSGAHAAMLAWLLGLRVAGRGGRFPASGRRTVVALAVLLVYALLTGCEPPVLRALCTFALGALATRLGRPLGLGPGLLVPALITCLLQPDALRGPSFLLSYAAVFGLSLAHEGSRGFWSRWLLAPLRASAWATLLTAPLTLWWFGQLAPWTVLLTPLLAPLVAVLLLGGLLLGVVGCVLPPLAAAVGPLLGRFADVYAGAVQLADALPGTPVHALAVPAGWALAVAGIAAAATLLAAPGRRGVVAAVLCLALPYFAPLPVAAPERLALFAVGHGQAALLRFADGFQAAIDCGSAQHPSLAARRLADGLSRRRIDLLVVTHADQDHHNGVRALVQRVPVRMALLPPGLGGSAVAFDLARHGVEVRVAAPGTRWQPHAQLLVDAPLLPADAADNDLSLWVRVALGGAHALLCGDAEERGVAAAIAQGLAAPSEVLVLPHHGRPNAMAPALLRAARPRVCFASAAAADGDTALAAVARAHGADVFATGLHGDLELLAGPPPTVRASNAARPVPRTMPAAPDER